MARSATNPPTMPQRSDATESTRRARRDDLVRVDDLLDGVCVAWERLADEVSRAGESELAHMEWAQSMARVLESLRAARASLDAMGEARSRPEPVH